MHLALPVSSALPLMRPPSFARDSVELKAVLATQDSEARVLRARLAEGREECDGLRRRLRDSAGELAAAAEATTSAAERLETHACRQGLVLAAGVERFSAERAAVEDELQRIERLLWIRDQEITRLRSAAREIEAHHLQGELELTGLTVAHDTTSSEVRALGVGVAELRHQVLALPSALPGAPMPSRNEMLRTDEADVKLAVREEDHAALRRRAEAAAVEARKLEGDVGTFTERVRSFEDGLRRGQEQQEMYDHRLVREAGGLREQCDVLRFALQEEQRDSTGADQRAMLVGRCGEEADNVLREHEAMLRSVDGLVSSLRVRGRSVVSPPVAGDVVDVHVHAYLSACGTRPDDLPPPLFWRLAPGQYLCGEQGVQLQLTQQGLVVRPNGLPLRHFVFEQARRARDGAGGRRINV